MKYTVGINDNDFIRGNIPMKKQEVRTLVLGKAQIKRDDIIIDMGAGTGSLSIEAAFQAFNGKVYAIEREDEGVQLIEANRKKFCRENLEIIHGSAPESAMKLPSADVILVGGSGGKLLDILHYSIQRLKSEGRLIITAVTIETLYTALHFMQDQSNFSTEAFGVQITRLKNLSASNMFQALNPIYIITCIKS